MSKRIYNINYHTSAPGERTIYARSFLNLQVRLIRQDYDHQVGVALDLERSGATRIKFSFRNKAFFITWWATRIRKHTT
jgi:hypothetical protein